MTVCCVSRCTEAAAVEVRFTGQATFYAYCRRHDRRIDGPGRGWSPDQIEEVRAL